MPTIYMFIPENYSSEFTIMFFQAPALNFPAKNGIPEKSLDMSLFHAKYTFKTCQIIAKK